MIAQDSQHQKAVAIIRKNENILVLTDDIIAEVITVLKRLKKLERAKIFVKMLQATSEIEIVPSSSYYQDTIDFFLDSNDTKLSFVDMSLVVLSKKYRIESFDRALKAAIQN